MSGTRSWSTEQFGLRIHDDATDTTAHRLSGLVQPGLRRNPRRAHLLVSTVLGKHLAVHPTIVRNAARTLGDLVRSLGLGDADVLGMAETATGLGHCVAERIDAPTYLHSTRRPTSARNTYAEFQEGHSHATDHLLQPAGPVLSGQRPLVIVDDEISTGTTALAAIEALHRQLPRSRYVVASLVDVRSHAHRQLAKQSAQAHDITIDFVCLAGGTVSVPSSLVEEVQALPDPKFNPVHPKAPGPSRTVSISWPEHVPDGGRHGFLRTDSPAFKATVARSTAQIAALLDPDRPVLVVGHEELMYLPLCIAETLAARGLSTRFQTTTRSPAFVVDAHGYPLRIGFEFSAGEIGESGSRYLYNGWPGGVGANRPQLVLIMDSLAAYRTDSLIAVLTAAGYDVTLTVVDSPDFSALSTARSR
ncbi:phosphoribosyltransferase family protein [Mycobacterium frederiksbergense]|uniref:phosphoribosyltransferase family protein n=1 Tax=Mycolicibacterium frederiksbergense TaxID=117567 RepID=UPI0021F34B8A|nr:phosphoribosyltransferase family protein [Mycolicibacterium frederiksbergense]MCV7045995.1 phosphoribosyltransferase family protein [Mycolicibacterium frederiksbergense]